MKYVIGPVLLLAALAGAQWLEMSVGVGGSSRELCYSPQNNKIYLANRASGSVTIIDGATLQRIRSIAGTGEGRLCYNPTSNVIYCADYWDKALTVIDVATNTVLVTIAVDSHPSAMAWNPIQNRTYVLCGGDGGNGHLAVIRDSIPSGVEESFKPQAASYRPRATILSGVLRVGDRGPGTGDRMELLDATGRRVMALRTGANDVSGLAPGVYFLREARAQAQAQAQATRKVVLQK